MAIKAEDLTGRFVKNFVKYATNEEGKALIAAGPKSLIKNTKNINRTLGN